MHFEVKKSGTFGFFVRLFRIFKLDFLSAIGTRGLTQAFKKLSLK